MKSDDHEVLTYVARTERRLYPDVDYSSIYRVSYLKFVYGLVLIRLLNSYDFIESWLTVADFVATWRFQQL